MPLYFKDLYIYLKEEIPPENVKRAKTIPYEANQYEMLHDTLFRIHNFQPRSKNKSVAEVILAVPKSLRNDVLKLYHESLAGGCYLGVQRTNTAKRNIFGPACTKMCMIIKHLVMCVKGLKGIQQQEMLRRTRYQ